MRDTQRWLVRGYDVHVVFPHNQAEHAQAVMAAFLSHIDACGIPYERPILFPEPVGPWTTPMWQVLLRRADAPDALAADLGHCIGWLMANRGDLSVMIHPNSADGDRTDHANNAMWLGPPTPLKLDIFA